MKPSIAVSASLAGVVYFAIIFALGFVLGTTRYVVLSVWTGIHPAWGILLELPIILAASWVCCGWVITRFGVSGRVSARAWMGVMAFAVLMVAEALLATWLMGQSMAEHAASYRDPTHMLGLAGQLAFAAIPLVRR